jgi:IS30 family transposase
MTKKYFQLNPEQRYQIAALLKAGHSKAFIAKQLDVHKSTIGRELKRTSNSKQRYNPALAQQFVNDRQKDKKHFSFFSIEMKTFIQNQLRSQQWSPEQISGYCKANRISMVSHELIYQYVYSDLREGGQLYLQLRTQNKRRRKRTHRKDKRGLIANRISIHQRPAVVAEKQRYGDWEIDLIEGANHKNSQTVADN